MGICPGEARCEVTGGGSAKQYSNEKLRGGNPSALVPAQLKTSQKSPAGVSFSGDTEDDRRGRGPTVPKTQPTRGTFPTL